MRKGREEEMSQDKDCKRWVFPSDLNQDIERFKRIDKEMHGKADADFIMLSFHHLGIFETLEQYFRTLLKAKLHDLGDLIKILKSLPVYSQQEGLVFTDDKRTWERYRKTINTLHKLGLQDGVFRKFTTKIHSNHTK